MNIFRQLDNEYQLTKMKLQSSTDPEELRFEARKLELLQTFLSYMESLAWMKHRQTKEKVKAYLKSNFQYRAVAEKLGISLNSLQVSVSYAAKKLEEKLGAALQLVKEGDLEAAERAFLVAIGRKNPSDLFLSGLADVLPEADEISDVDLTECSEELKLLRFFTIGHVQKLVGKYDVRKIKQLLYIILSQDPVYIRERDILLRYVDGEISMEEALGRLKLLRE